MQQATFTVCASFLFAVALSLHATANERLMVVLVRHGEKVDTSSDAALSPAGQRRAQRLAATLRDVRIGHVHSSDYRRTRDTAGPTAERLRLKLQLYDPTDLPTLVKQLKAKGGRHLVVGHSNTTPAMVELLGGVPGPDIDEGGEFDRLYIVTVDSTGDVSTVLMRYGAPFSRLNSAAQPSSGGQP